MPFEIDQKFKNYFRGIKQVFLYLTDECNLNCVYCLNKPNLIFRLKEKEVPLETALNLISAFREMGASKLTIMGGEPTLYGISDCWKPLLGLISASKKFGYEYVRMDTNGMFSSSLLRKKEFKMLDEITYSLDAHVRTINDRFRGRGTFSKCVSNIKASIQLGYKTDVTCCVHKLNIGKDRNGNLFLDKMILFAESLGVNRINFHPILKMGVPRDAWIGDVDIRPHEWLLVFNAIRKNIMSNRYKIPVRIPQRFITQGEFDKNPEYYGYCPVKLGERALIHPDGIIRVCALLIGSVYGLGRFNNNKIIWDEALTNETRNHRMDESTQCPNQRKSFDDLIPLCISFKPQQEETVWMDKLNWECRRRYAE